MEVGDTAYVVGWDGMQKPMPLTVCIVAIGPRITLVGDVTLCKDDKIMVGRHGLVGFPSNEVYKDRPSVPGAEPKTPDAPDVPVS